MSVRTEIAPPGAEQARPLLRDFIEGLDGLVEVGRVDLRSARFAGPSGVRVVLDFPEADAFLLLAVLELDEHGHRGRIETGLRLRARFGERGGAQVRELRQQAVHFVPVDIGRVLSLQFETFTIRLLDLAFETHGPAPVPWAWLALGSAARREFTLGSDQENALAYADVDSDAEVDRYFEQIATDVNRGLARCGFPPDPNDVVSGSALWRMSASDWVQVFRDCLESPDRSHLIRANVSFDFRSVAGGLELTPALVSILRDAKNHPDFIRRLARSATDFKPPLGFRGSLPEKSFDLKKEGMIPIANLARFYAFANGITISSTLDRLVAAEEMGALDSETALSLREAFEVVARIRLNHHAACIEAGKDPDNLVDPKDLPPLTRVHLREAFRAVAAAQKKLSVYVPLGM